MQPAVVLVRPQLGENIGKAARAMLNFGLTDLRLVAPRDGWPNPDAGPAASGADVVLANARLFETLADAVADCVHVYATTVRKRGVTKPVLAPAQAAEQIHAEAGQSALVFGAERSGLDSDDVALAHSIVTVPINPDFGSLNLAQAVIINAYEWSKHVNLAQPPAVALDPPAPHAEFEDLIGHAIRNLDAAGYFNPPERRKVTLRSLRTLLTKAPWTSNDVRMMRGILTTLARPQQRD
jgi:tRNA/rRNA methyltransferase